MENANENKNETRKELSTNIIGDNTGLSTLSEKVGQYVTFDLSSNDNKVKLYNALQKCDVKLIDIKEQEIEIEGIYVKRSDVVAKDESGKEIVDAETGEVKTKPHYRTVLFGTNGLTYVSSAYGIYNSLQTIIPIFGIPTKENPFKVKVTGRVLPNGRGESLILMMING